MNEELTNLLEGIETANNIQQYEEAFNLKDKIHTVGNAIKNALGSQAGQAGRANTDAQTALNTAKTNQQAQKTNAQTNAINNALDDLTLAKNLNDIVTNALVIVEKGLASLQQQEPKQKKQKQQSQVDPATAQKVADNEAGKNGGVNQTNDEEEMLRNFESVSTFANALREAADTNTKSFYNKAKKSLTAIQSELRPFLTGQKDFTVADLDNISNLINDQSISTVLGKNDKKALQTIQNVNSMIKNKKIAIGDDGSTTQNNQSAPQQQAPAQNGSAPTAEQQKQPEQKGNAANIQQGDANVIDSYLDSAAKDLGKSKDDIIAFLKTK